MLKARLFVGGRSCDAAGGQQLDVINPADESLLGTACSASREDVNVAVAAAREALEAWASTSGKERAVVLRAIADSVEKHKDSLAEKEALNAGKPIQEAAWDMDDVAACFRHHADLAEKLEARQGKVVDVGMQEFSVKMFWEPVGVVGLIVPWNYPLLMATWKVAAALAAGCTIVLKPSELTPFTAYDLAVYAFEEAKLPAGVLNVLPGLGPDCGAPLSEHQDVDKIAFTGSVPTGSRIMAACARDIRNVSLELGGKSPIVVFDDADVEKAVEWIMFGIFWTNGQICSATSRAIIHEAIAPRIFARLKEEAEKVKACHPMTPPSDKVAYIGPIICKTQYDKVLQYVESGKQEGASLLCGGGRPKGVPDKGFYVAPTIFTGVQPSMRIWKEEIFGPVLAATTFKTEAEAIALANDTWAGLASAVLTADQDRSMRMARKFKCGIVWVNCSQPCFCQVCRTSLPRFVPSMLQVPWGGVRKSGFGRDNGEYGLESFLEVKQVTEYKSSEPWGWYMPPGFTRPAEQPKPESKL
eukprot:768762-Hanusia_phi.AAC.2